MRSGLRPLKKQRPCRTAPHAPELGLVSAKSLCATISCDEIGPSEPGVCDPRTQSERALSSVALGQIRVRRSGQPRPPLAGHRQRSPSFPRPCSRDRSLRSTPPRSSSASSSARRSSCSRRSSPATVPTRRRRLRGLDRVRHSHAVRRAHRRRAGVGVSARRRRVRLSARGVLAGRRRFCGAGRCSGRCTPASSPSSRWCSRATSRSSFRSATSAFACLRRRAIVVLTAVNYVGVRQGSLVQTTLTILKVGAIVAIIVAVVRARPASRSARARRCGHIRAGRSHRPKLRAGARRRPVRVRRLAHGDLRRRGDARARAHDSARAGRRRAHRHGCYIALNAAYFHVLPPTAIAGSTASPPTPPTPCSAAAARR